MTKTEEKTLALHMSGLEEILAKQHGTDHYLPVTYLLLLQKHGGFDALTLERVPSEIIGMVAADMGISVATLNLRRSEWNRDGKMAKARDILQPYFNEQFAVAVDYLQSAIPALMYKLVEKAMGKDASYGVVKDALNTALKLSEPRKGKAEDTSAEEDEAYIQGVDRYEDRG